MKRPPIKPTPPAEPPALFATRRYNFAALDRVGCQLLYEMLKAVDADAGPAGDRVFRELVEHMVARQISTARRRRIRRAAQRNGATS